MEGRGITRFLLDFFERRDFDRLRQRNWRHYRPGELHQQYVLTFLVIFLFVCPFLLLVALLPFWDKLGEWSIVKSFDALLVPGIEGLPTGPPRGFNQRRFLIGSSATLTLFFLVQWIVVLCSRRLRFLALELYDLMRAKFFVFMLTIAAGFVLAWYLAFFGPDLSGLSPRERGRMTSRIIVFLPIITLMLGQLTGVMLLGLIRDIRHLPRTYRNWRSKKAGRVI